MIYLRTGTPGASKTLNAIKEICEDSVFANRKIYYHNIKCVALDLDFLNSFEGFFYCHFFPNCTPEQSRRVSPIINAAHKEGRLVSQRDAAFLRGAYESYNYIHCFTYWATKLYPASRISSFLNFIEQSSYFDYDIKLEDVRAFNLDFIRFDDPFLWYELPSGSVILIDEIQDFYCKRSPSTKAPVYIELFNKHRHYGFDLHLITQSSSLIDYQLKECVGRHIHYRNKHGGETVFRFEHGRVFNTTSSAEISSIDKVEQIKRDKNFYGSYWSSELHTHKYRMPQHLKRLFIWVPSIILLVLIFVFSLSGLSDKALDIDKTKNNNLEIQKITENNKNENKNSSSPGCITLKSGRNFCS